MTRRSIYVSMVFLSSVFPKKKQHSRRASPDHPQLLGLCVGERTQMSHNSDCGEPFGTTGKSMFLVLFGGCLFPSPLYGGIVQQVQIINAPGSIDQNIRINNDHISLHPILSPWCCEPIDCCFSCPCGLPRFQ